MKKRRRVVTLITTTLMASVLLNFSSCTDDSSPLSPHSMGIAETGGLNILKIGSGENRLNKITSVAQYVTPSEGGVLTLNHHGETADGEAIDATITLTVAPGAVNEDVQLSMSLDDQALDMQFGPEGTVFSTPALLTVEAYNLDLSVGADQISAYYFNPETNGWESISSENVVVMADIGYVKVVNAQLPHFSRYAIGYDD